MELHPPVSRTPVSSRAAGLDSESSEDDEESKWERRRRDVRAIKHIAFDCYWRSLLYRTMGCIIIIDFIYDISWSVFHIEPSLLGIVTTIMGISMLNLRLWWIPFVWSWRVFFVFVFLCIYIYTYWNLIKMGSIWTTDQNQDVFYMKNWSKLYVFSTALIKFGSMLIFRVKNCETCWCRQLIGGFCRYLVGLSFTVIEFDPLPHVRGIYLIYYCIPFASSTIFMGYTYFYCWTCLLTSYNI